MPGGAAKAPRTHESMVSGPTNVKRAVHVQWNPETGTFEGLPDVWKEFLPKGTSQNETSVAAVAEAHGIKDGGEGHHVLPQKPGANRGLLGAIANGASQLMSSATAQAS